MAQRFLMTRRKYVPLAHMGISKGDRFNVCGRKKERIDNEFSFAHEEIEVLLRYHCGGCRADGWKCISVASKSC